MYLIKEEKLVEQNDNTTYKLILLYVFDKMDIPLFQNTVLEMCAVNNSWTPYMECIECIGELIDVNYLFKTTHERNEYFSITPAGRECLESFFTHIPSSVRNAITKYIKENRIKFKRSQEYTRSYSKNDDGSYTVQLKIIDPVKTSLDIKLNVANRLTAKSITKKWESTAGEVLYAILDKLVD